MNKKTKEQQLKIAKYYMEIICQFDTSTVDRVKRNPEKIKALLKSYAGNISSFTKNTMIIADIRQHHGKYISVNLL